MITEFTLLKHKVAEFLAFAIIIGLVLIAPFVDILILKNSIIEISVTEFLQEFILAVIVVQI